MPAFSLLGILVKVCVCSVPMMMVAMMLVACIVELSPPPPPPTSIPMLLFTTMLYLGIVVFGSVFGADCVRDEYTCPSSGRKWLQLGVFAHCTVLLLILLLADPQAHLSVGVHQTYGDCGVEAVDYSGQMRHVYICEQDSDEDFSFYCPTFTSYYKDRLGTSPSSTMTEFGPLQRLAANELPFNMSEWYGICGRPKEPAWTVATAGLICMWGLAMLMLTLFVPNSFDSHCEHKSKSVYHWDTVSRTWMRKDQSEIDIVRKSIEARKNV
jgi:hypothetical protein